MESKAVDSLGDMKDFYTNNYKGNVRIIFMDELESNANRGKSILVLFGVVGCCGIPFFLWGSFFLGIITYLSWIQRLFIIAIPFSIFSVLVFSKGITKKEQATCNLKNAQSSSR